MTNNRQCNYNFLSSEYKVWICPISRLCMEKREDEKRKKGRNIKTVRRHNVSRWKWKAQLFIHFGIIRPNFASFRHRTLVSIWLWGLPSPRLLLHVCQKVWFWPSRWTPRCLLPSPVFQSTDISKTALFSYSLTILIHTAYILLI